MYQLYWALGTASFGPQAVLEEANLNYEIVSIDIASGENRKKSYIAINSTGTIPALGLPDGRMLYEAAAIMIYLSEHHQINRLLPINDSYLRGLLFQSLFYLSNTVQVGYKRFYYPERFSIDNVDSNTIKNKSIKDLISYWEPVNIHLQKSGPYHLGKRYSLVDIYLAMLVTWFDPMNDLLVQYPAINHCYQLVSQRPAVRKCLEMQNTISVGLT